MANPSLITTARTVDEAVALSATYQMDALDRRKIDNQIIGCQKHLADSLINGQIGTWFKTSEQLAPGDVVVVDSAVEAVSAVTRTVKKANTDSLANAGLVLAIALTAAPINGFVRCATSGLVERAITGLAKDDPGPVRVDPSTGRCERVASFDNGDYPVGFVDTQGNLSLAPTLAVGAGGGGGLEVHHFILDDANVVGDAAELIWAFTLPVYTADTHWLLNLTVNADIAAASDAQPRFWLEYLTTPIGLYATANQTSDLGKLSATAQFIYTPGPYYAEGQTIEIAGEFLDALVDIHGELVMTVLGDYTTETLAQLGG